MDRYITRYSRTVGIIASAVIGVQQNAVLVPTPATDRSIWRGKGKTVSIYKLNVVYSIRYIVPKLTGLGRTPNAVHNVKQWTRADMYRDGTQCTKTVL